MKPQRAEDYIRQFDEPVRKILRVLRRVVRHAVPDASEYIEKDMLAYAMGPNTYKASVCVISGHKAHVTLGFLRGTRLNDPGKQLQGEGKTVRHLKFTSADEIPEELFADWVRQAAALVPRS